MNYNVPSQSPPDVPINEFTPAGVGSLFVKADPSQGNGDSLAFDSTGSLFLAVGQEVEKFTPGGVGSTFVNLGFDPLFAAIGPSAQQPATPEPGSIALLVSGSIAAAGLLNRRRRSSR